MSRYAVAGGAIISATTRISPTASNAPTMVSDTSPISAYCTRAGAKPSATASAGSNVDGFRLLPEDRDRDDVQHEDGAHDDERGRAPVPAPELDPVERSEGELAEQHRIDVEMDVVRVAEIRITPTEKSAGKTGPIAASSTKPRPLQQLDEHDGS